jgi:CBS domain containing-hemolysin-like protein
MSGTVRLDRFADAVGLVLPNGDYETIAGFVMDRLGHIPDVGETVDHQGFRIVVTTMEGVRIAEVDVVRAPLDGAAAGGTS